MSDLAFECGDGVLGVSGAHVWPCSARSSTAAVASCGAATACWLCQVAVLGALECGERQRGFVRQRRRAGWARWLRQGRRASVGPCSRRRAALG